MFNAVNNFKVVVANKKIERSTPDLERWHAARAGKHVIVEKPLDITGPRCRDIIDACTRANVKLCTIFPSRFGDANRELKAAGLAEIQLSTKPAADEDSDDSDDVG